MTARPAVRRHARLLVMLLVLLAPVLAAGAELVADVRDYQAALEAVVSAEESQLSRARELVADRRRHRLRGNVTDKDVQDAEKAVKEAELNVHRARRRLREADEVITEAMAMDQLWAPRGSHPRESVLLATGPGAPWSTDAMAAIERFFEGRFGRPLPVSARGQTAVHDRLHLDHSHAVDVAVHPTSTEGQALIDYLRRAGIAFLAFRSASPGAATGAHIHIGIASRRLSMLSRASDETID